jgi:hypothetical protein
MAYRGVRPILSKQEKSKWALQAKQRFLLLRQTYPLALCCDDLFRNPLGYQKWPGPRTALINRKATVFRTKKAAHQSAQKSKVERELQAELDDAGRTEAKHAGANAGAGTPLTNYCVARWESWCTASKVTPFQRYFSVCQVMCRQLWVMSSFGSDTNGTWRVKPSRETLILMAGQLRVQYRIGSGGSVKGSCQICRHDSSILLRTLKTSQ